MIVAVASGKGGTGKTTVSASLAHVWESDLLAVDLDVEEPNLHLFLNPELDHTENISMEVPVLDESRCTTCGKCSELCQFKAITSMGTLVMTFPEMCHGCGGCFAVCPDNALRTGSRPLGELCSGWTSNERGKHSFLMGRLRVGEAMSPPLMREVKRKMMESVERDGVDVLVDSPPGVSCPAMNAVMDSDVILLVAESTPFGLHDFVLAWEAFSSLDIPMAVVINRSGSGDDSVRQFCREKGLPLLAEIPDDREIAEAYSRGQVPARVVPGLGGMFTSIMRELEQMAKEAAHA